MLMKFVSVSRRYVTKQDEMNQAAIDDMATGQLAVSRMPAAVVRVVLIAWLDYMDIYNIDREFEF